MSSNQLLTTLYAKNASNLFNLCTLCTKGFKSTKVFYLHFKHTPLQPKYVFNILNTRFIQWKRHQIKQNVHTSLVVEFKSIFGCLNYHCFKAQCDKKYFRLHILITYLCAPIYTLDSYNHCPLCGFPGRDSETPVVY